MKKFLLLSVVLGSFFMGCTENNPSFSGATSETTNGIAVVVVDAARKPLAQARVTLYAKSDMSALETSVSDSFGKANFESTADACAGENCFIEGIAGADSSLMSWSPLELDEDSATSKISLLPSSSLMLRTGADDSGRENLFANLQLQLTPYFANRSGNEYVFAHVPAGLFNVVAGDSTVAEVSLEPGAVADTLVRMSGVTREFVFDDFEDGDSLNNIAKKYTNYGWYYIAKNGAKLLKPDSTKGFAAAIEKESGRGKVLSVQYVSGDSDYVLLGTHLGLDTGYYDLSRLTAIRLTVSGDCNFDVALEHYQEVGDNNFRKSLWNVDAAEGWHEVVLRPGKEKLDENSYQVAWNEISKEIGFFSIFIKSGSFLKIDQIVFEGIDGVSP
jgi:hypothetical protein